MEINDVLVVLAAACPTLLEQDTRALGQVGVWDPLWALIVT